MNTKTNSKPSRRPAKETKKCFFMEGIFHSISEKEVLNIPGREPVERAIVTVVTEDGQKGFFQVRARMIRNIQIMRIQPGDYVKIGFVMLGSEKNGKQFNNFFINEIEVF